MEFKYFIHFLMIWVVKLLFPKYWGLPTSVVYAQSAHETGWFGSNKAKNHNNLFGMKVPRLRNYHSGEDSNGFATFKNKWLSIYDYFKRQRAFKIDFRSVDQYITDTQNSGYSAYSPTYVEKWYATMKAKGTTSVLWVRWLGVSILSIIPFGLVTYFVIIPLWRGKKKKRKK